MPILIQSLAESFLAPSKSHLPLLIHKSLLAVLDTGVLPDSLAAIVNDYMCDWWNYPNEPEHHVILSWDNVDDAEDFHWTQTLRAPLPRMPIFPQVAVTPVPLDCPKCADYCHMAAELISKLQSIHAYAQATETSAETTCKTNIRRAQGLYLLYKAIVQKKTSPPHPTIVMMGAASDTALAPTAINSIKVSQQLQHIFN